MRPRRQRYQLLENHHHCFEGHRALSGDFHIPDSRVPSIRKQRRRQHLRLRHSCTSAPTRQQLLCLHMAGVLHAYALNPSGQKNKATKLIFICVYKIVQTYSALIVVINVRAGYITHTWLVYVH